MTDLYMQYKLSICAFISLPFPLVHHVHFMIYGIPIYLIPVSISII